LRRYAEPIQSPADRLKDPLQVGPDPKIDHRGEMYSPEDRVRPNLS
jgi:hypothetical protein